MAKRVWRWILAALFVTAGIIHFARPAPFVSIVPPVLPSPLILVYISGLAEIAGGLGLLIPQLRRAAGIGLVLLLVAVFPANSYMAWCDVEVAGTRFPWWAHAIRLPLQLVLIALVVWAADLRRSKTA